MEFENLIDVEHQKNARNNGVVERIFEEWFTDRGQKWKSICILDIAGKMERHKKSSKGEAEDHKRPEIYPSHVFGVPKEIRNPISMSNVSREERSQRHPEE